MKKKKRQMIKVVFGITFLIGGVLFNFFNIGMNNNLGFDSIGNWMIVVGVLSIALAVMMSLKKKGKKIDERMEFIGWKSARVSFVIFILLAVAIMIADAIEPLNISIHMLMNYMICGLTLISAIIYKIMERKY